MFLCSVELVNFRNYERLRAQLDTGITLLLGPNASGKSAFLESLYMLATMTSPRARTEQEVLRLGAQWEFGAPPTARVAAQVQRGDGPLHLAMAVQQIPPPSGQGGGSGRCRKVVRVNRRLVPVGKAVGQLQVVLFCPEDLYLVAGSPARRRRYLDSILLQTDPRYYAAFQRYRRVLCQRNKLLRRWQGKGLIGNDQEIAYWDQELVHSGTYILLARERLVAGIGPDLAQLHQELSGENAPLGLEYRSGVAFSSLDDEASVAYAFRRAMGEARDRERRLGQTLVGPHRDDLAFLLGEMDLAAYGSRGQQRTVVVALKLAEAEWRTRQYGDPPVVLLDDVLAELDVQRRNYFQNWLLRMPAEQQSIVTASEAAVLHPMVLARARAYWVGGGKWQLAERQAAIPASSHG